MQQFRRESFLFRFLSLLITSLFSQLIQPWLHISGHLIFKFSISETDWHRIKLNVDSKCRTAHRRRTRGLPLTVKSFRGRSQPEYVHTTAHGLPTHIELGFHGDELDGNGELHIHQVLMFIPNKISTSGCYNFYCFVLAILVVLCPC